MFKLTLQLGRVKLSHLYKILLILHCLSSTLSNRPDANERTLLSPLKKLYRNYGYCGSRSCPPWKCEDDSAVIHGYCCHCPGSEYDNVPVLCAPHLRCPTSPEPLCSDYNFMMDCCCTGP